LLEHTLISTARNAVTWEEWLNWQRVDLDTKHVDSLQLDPSHLSIEAAVSGVGVILESSILVESPLATGRLIAPFPDSSLPGLSYWLFAPSRRKDASAVDAVMEWLQATVAPSMQRSEARDDPS
jgi:LysR family glycine cleavage system transcriptional activator